MMSFHRVGVRKSFLPERQEGNLNAFQGEKK